MRAANAADSADAPMTGSADVALAFCGCQARLLWRAAIMQVEPQIADRIIYRAHLEPHTSFREGGKQKSEDRKAKF